MNTSVPSAPKRESLYVYHIRVYLLRNIIHTGYHFILITVQFVTMPAHHLKHTYYHSSAGSMHAHA